MTSHISIACWTGGGEAFESRLCQPHNFEKINAWAKFASDSGS